MVKGIHTLIKLHKRTLDELRRKMTNLENQKNQLRTSLINLQKELEQEMALAGQQAEMAGFFGDFSKRIRKRQETIVFEIQALDIQIVKLSDEISVAFAELKKFEIARDNAKKCEQAAQNRKDTIMLDEIAIQQHRRKEDV
ncbi:MAG: flagellar FliJ family protein [Rickettsiales bacterium]|nr:flagellar FliJ family protein [Rickettsiales bacterium]